MKIGSYASDLSNADDFFTCSNGLGFVPPDSNMRDETRVESSEPKDKVAKTKKQPVSKPPADSVKGGGKKRNIGKITQGTAKITKEAPNKKLKQDRPISSFAMKPSSF